MEKQKIINLLDNIPNQSYKFKTKIWIEINYDSRRIYNTNSQIRVKTSMLKSSLSNDSDTYKLVKEAITLPNTGTASSPNNREKKLIFKNCAPFNYSKTSGSLWQYYRDELVLTDAGAIDSFLGNSASFKFKQKITGKTGSDSTKYVELMVLLKYLSNFGGTLEILLINCKINTILICSANCFIVAETADNQFPTFAITNTLQL